MKVPIRALRRLPFGLEKVTQGTYPKRAIILISDGQDNKSRTKFKELHEMLRSSGVLVYALGIFDTKNSGPLPEAARRSRRVF